MRKKHRRFSESELAAFRVFFSKGCVDLPSAERAAYQARRIIIQYLTKQEIWDLGTAESHAKDVGEGRTEWDSICKKVKQRLGV